MSKRSSFYTDDQGRVRYIGSRKKAQPTSDVPLTAPRREKGNFITTDEGRVVFIGGPSAGSGGTSAVSDREAASLFLASDSLNPLLSQSEITTMTDYKGDGYYDINSQLRDYRETESGIEDDIDPIIERGKVPSDIIVFRGVDYDAIDEDDLTGTIFRDNAYVSTTLRQELTRSYGNVLLRIHVPAGTPALNMQRFSYSITTDNEAELLLGRKTRFNVLADNGYDSNPRIIDMEVVK